MTRCVFIWMVLTCMVAGYAFAQPLKPQKEYRILLLFNGGHSMADNWTTHESKYQLSSRIITALMDSMYTINDQVAFGLNVYGHLYPQTLNKCNDSRREVIFNKDNRAQVNLRLLDLKPKGTASLSYAIQAAAENNLTDTEHYYYSVLVITDSSDYCNKDICGLTKEILKKKVNFKTYVITIGNREIAKKYNCLGESLPITTDEDITPAIRYITSSYRRFLPERKAEITNTRKNKPAETSMRTDQSKAGNIPIARIEVIRSDSFILHTTDTVKATPAVSIRKNSNITTEEEDKRFGYLEFKNNYNGSLTIYYYKNGKYLIIDAASSIVRTTGYRIKLKVGQYKIVYGNHEKTFRIVKNMITDIWLN